MKRHRLTGDELNAILKLSRDNMSVNDIASAVGCCGKTVRRTLTRYETTNSVEYKGVPGRPVCLSDREKRRIVRTMTAPDAPSVREVSRILQSSGIPKASRSNIQRTLSEKGVKAFKKRKCPVLDRKHKK